MMEPAVTVERDAWREGACDAGARCLAEETAVAITYNRVTHAVMMATPADLRDFAIGFSLSEDVVPSPSAVEEFSVTETGDGVELRLWIAAGHMAALEKRRRRLAGVTGCGICGLESLAEAIRRAPQVPVGRVFGAASIARAAASLSGAQILNRQTRAMHAAGFWTEAQGLVALREDVGRHNALDKLGGALALAGISAETGIIVMTSRISIELVQKAARMGAPMLVAASAPTALAVRTAEAAGMTLVGIARDDGFEVFSRSDRLTA